jgi:uncharacterized protein
LCVLRFVPPSLSRQEAFEMIQSNQPSVAPPTAPYVGQFVWADLMTNDREAAIRFYTAVMGWQITFFEMGAEPYPMWTIPGAGPGASIGGSMQMPPGDPNPPHWMLHLAVANCAERTAHAASLGATVLVPPQDVPTVGQFAVIRDPQGAVVSLYAPLEDPKKGEPAIGDFSWFELATPDREASLRFYSSLVGWEATALHDMGGGMLYQLVRRPGDAMESVGMYTMLGDQPMPPAWTPYTRVANLDASVAMIQEKGGQVIAGPMEVPGGDRVAVAIDPQGAMFAIQELAAR